MRECVLIRDFCFSHLTDCYCPFCSLGLSMWTYSLVMAKSQQMGHEPAPLLIIPSQQENQWKEDVDNAQWKEDVDNTQWKEDVDNTQWKEDVANLQESKDHFVMQTPTKPTKKAITIQKNSSGKKHYVYKRPYDYPCTVCGLKYRSQSELKYHMGKHTGELPYKCRKCNKRYKTEEERDTHDKTSHRQYMCEVCGYNARIPRDMRDHLRIHTQEKPFQCTQCDKTFGRKINLSAHLKAIHANVRPYQCSYCGSSFKTGPDLRLHERRHTGERPYKCTYCDKRFFASSDLKIHTRTHTGEKPYKCQFCDKAFVESANRKAHEMIHTGEKPHKCDKCPAGFIRADFLRKHYDTVHKTRIIALSAGVINN